MNFRAAMVLAVCLCQTVLASANESILDRFSRADSVVIIQINHRSYISDMALSRPGAIAVESVEYTGVVVKSWKGFEEGAALSFIVDLESCEKMLNNSAEYLLFGDASSGQLHSLECADTVLVEAAAGIIAQLDSL